jgi:hypothetical protein
VPTTFQISQLRSFFLAKISNCAWQLLIFVGGFRSQREKFIHVIKEMLLFEESVDGVGTVSRKLMREKVKPDSKANSRA